MIAAPIFVATLQLMKWTSIIQLKWLTIVVHVIGHMICRSIPASLENEVRLLTRDDDYPKRVLDPRLSKLRIQRYIRTRSAISMMSVIFRDFKISHAE